MESFQTFQCLHKTSGQEVLCLVHPPIRCIKGGLFFHTESLRIYVHWIFKKNIHFSHIDLRKQPNKEEFLQVNIWKLYNDQFWQQCEVESSWIFKKQFSLFTYWLQRAAKCKGVSSINHLRTLKRPNWQQCEVESSWIFKNNFRFSHIDNGQIDSNVKWSPEILWISAS